MIIETDPEIPNENYDDLIKNFSDEIGILQREAHQLNIPIIIIFEGWYDVFVGEVINRQLLPLDPRGFDFYFTDAPTSEENKKPFMTRFFQKIPPKGKISIFDRSWYMRGLIEYLLDEKDSCQCSLSKKTNFAAVMSEPVDKDVIYTKKFNNLIEKINRFEKTLTDNGVRIIKIYFGARKEKRIESRKMWQKIVPYNIDKRSVDKIYKKDISVLKEMIEQTNTSYAPWNLYFVKENIELSTLQTMKILIDHMKAITRFENKELPCVCPTDSENSSCKIEIIQNHLKTADLTKSYSKKEYKKKLKKYQKELFYAHYLLHLKNKPMVLVFEGWDAAGKGGGIKRIAQAMNPRHYRVIPIGAPTNFELRYHYLWRFMDGVPSCGKTSVFDRSWYGRVLVERVEKLNTEEEWKRAYSEINHFEKAMTDSGIIVIKFWMHISKDRQYERFKARSENPLKQWKLTDEDWRNREKWNEYYDAVNEMIEKTSTEKAPWVIVESDDKYYSRIKILKTVIKRIENELGKEIKEIDI